MLRRSLLAGLSAVVSADEALARSLKQLSRARGYLEHWMHPAQDTDTPWLIDDLEVLSLFVQATGTERETSRPFIPWGGKLGPTLFSTATEGEIRLISEAFTWLSAVTEWPLQLTGNASPNIAIFLSDGLEAELDGPAWRTVGEPLFGTPREMRLAIRGKTGCFAVTNSARTAGLIALPASGSQIDTACVYRALLELLGLNSMLPGSVPSLLANASPAQEPTPLDRLLAAIAGHPMLAREVRQEELHDLVQDILSEQRAWAGFDALEAGVGLPQNREPADSYSPSAKRSVHAFAALAVPDSVIPLLRWDSSVETAIHCLGEIPNNCAEIVPWCLEWARAASGLQLRTARHVREDGMTFIFTQDPEVAWDTNGPALQAYFGFNISRYRSAIDRVWADEGGFTILHYNKTHALINRSLSLIDAQPDTELFMQRFGRQILRALGLRGVMAGNGHSLLDARIMARQPTALDMRVVRLLYAPDLSPGLHRATALDRVRSLVDPL